MAASPSVRRSIPAAPFVHDVNTYLSQSGLDVNSALSALQERLQQYKLAEMKLLAQKRELQAKIPDIKKCLAIVESLISKQGTGEGIIADFELAEGIYSQARIEETQTAETLLKKNLENANVSLQAIAEDSLFLRDQITITEVTIARVYNWDVHQRRKQRQASAEG